MKNIKKNDGSFVVEVNNLPYNTIKGDIYYDEIVDLYNSNPELFECEMVIEADIKDMKNLKLQEAKSWVEDVIYSEYPQYLQNNIAIFGSDEDRNNFKNFKLEKTNRYDEIVADIICCDSIKNLKNIKII